MRKLIILIFLVLLSLNVFSQDSPGASTNNGSVYLYSGTLQGSEQLKIKTYIWGRVRNPGLYIIPDNTDLLTLISSAGGPLEDAKLSKVRIVRSIEGSEKVIWVDLKEYLKTGDTTLIPILQPGDTVIVSGTTFYAFTKVTDWLSKIAVALSVYITISNLN